MKNLTKAVISVMNDVQGIDKSLNVGSGSYGYKGVSDKDVKLKIGSAMRKNGLIILPTRITPKTDINRYEVDGKQKLSVFTEVITTYRLMHESGEFIEIAGYGHGVDTGDKAAGKATTYAMKYALLYQFMIATGHIDDADVTHSDEIHKKTTTKNISNGVMNEIFKSINSGKIENNKNEVDKYLIDRGYTSLPTDKWDALQKAINK